jgi:hypothetical protein
VGRSGSTSRVVAESFFENHRHLVEAVYKEKRDLELIV